MLEGEDRRFPCSRGSREQKGGATFTHLKQIGAKRVACRARSAQVAAELLLVPRRALPLLRLRVAGDAVDSHFHCGVFGELWEGLIDLAVGYDVDMWFRIYQDARAHVPRPAQRERRLAVRSAQGLRDRGAGGRAGGRVPRVVGLDDHRCPISIKLRLHHLSFYCKL